MKINKNNNNPRSCNFLDIRYNYFTLKEEILLEIWFDRDDQISSLNRSKNCQLTAKHAKLVLAKISSLLYSLYLYLIKIFSLYNYDRENSTNLIDS